MKLFYECQCFDEELPLDKSFAVKQKELFFKTITDQQNRKYSFGQINVEYRCKFEKSSTFVPEKPTMIIPIKNSTELLKHTIKNFLDNDVTEHCNILIVDDRSEQDIKSVVVSNDFSYLRVDNDKGFNFSMLNNIAAKICHQLGNETIILWNSDLWVKDSLSLRELLDRHKKDGSKLSGSKLVYPPISVSLNKEEDSPNIMHYFPHLSGGKWRNTVQFGGDAWIPTPNTIITHSPVHHRRFTIIEDPLVNCDRGALFVTGALHIYDLGFFIKLGGLNPSLSKVFQDVDISLRAYESGHCPMYYGKDLYFYHDESLSLTGQKEDGQYRSDHYLFSKIWNNKLSAFLGYKVE